MCFYNSQSKRAMELAKRYGRKLDILEIVQEILDEQYRITAFTHPHCYMITGSENLQTAQWGFIPYWTKTEEDASKIQKMTWNACSETVFNLPSFRGAIKTNRCLIPSTGYFEFHHEEKETIPYYLFLKNKGVFSLGGIYDEWQNPITKEIVTTFSIITVPANELCKQIHNGGKNPFRMPLIIPQENEEKWLDITLNQTKISNLFRPFSPELMSAHPVSKNFLKKSAKDASVIEPAA